MIHDRIFQLSPPTQYWAPIDEDQKECYDVAHHFLKMVKNNRLFEAPLGDNPSRILDLGTGTGIWAIDMADEYPLAEVIGTDICLIQPAWVPPNCTFYIEDAESEWKDPNASLDFVHIRALYGGVSDWPQLYREAHEVLVPGGWIEHLEFDITPHSEVSEIMDDEDHIFNQWSKALLDAMDRTGKTGRIGMGGNIRKYLEGTGFVDIVEKTYRIPCGRWGKDEKQKEIGDYCQLFMDMGLEGFALRLLKETTGWEYAEITKIVDRMRSALSDKRTQAYFLVTNVYAKRPELPKGQMTTCLCYCHAGTAGENGSGRRRRRAAKGVHEDAAGGLADVKHCNEVSIEGLQPSM
ncbi:UMTA protein [Dactylonectria macrodidyma]|uniref:UMTA protein n=1 Tax=Dactylonectria macrodidyma TaxID=307937 RepID=A0A9P9J4F9_9HYPO|nr:UMTA protein [Dactylonectria macrodidyma]